MTGSPRAGARLLAFTYFCLLFSVPSHASPIDQPLNVLDYGVMGDAHWGDTACTWSPGTSVQIECDNYTFSSGDLGKKVILNLADNGFAPLVSTFTTPFDSHHITVAGTITNGSNYVLPTALDPDTPSSGPGYSGIGYLPGDTVCVSGYPSLCATVKVVTLVTVPTVTNAGSCASGGTSRDGTDVVLTGTSAALAGKPFTVKATVSGGHVTHINSIAFGGYYDTAPASLLAEPVTGDNMTGVMLNLTGGMLPGGFGVPAGGLALQRSTTAYTGFSCPSGPPGSATTGGSGTGLRVDCTTIGTTASWGTDNTAAFQSALAAMQNYNNGAIGTPLNVQYTPKCLYIPAGNYLTQPWNTQVIGRNDYCGDSTWNLWLSNVFVIPNTAGDMIQIVDAGRNGFQQPLGGTITYSDTSPEPRSRYMTAGCGVNGITFVGLRESTAIQNAVMVYGPALWCHFGYYVYYMGGRALGVGADSSGDTSLAESILDDYRFERDGDVDQITEDRKIMHVPTIDITALGQGTVNNIRSKTGRIFQSFGASARFADCGSSTTGAHNITLYGGTHFEASGMAGTGAGGDLLQLGNSNCEGEEWPKLGGEFVSGTNGNVAGSEVDAHFTTIRNRGSADRRRFFKRRA